MTDQNGQTGPSPASSRRIPTPRARPLGAAIVLAAAVLAGAAWLWRLRSPGIEPVPPGRLGVFIAQFAGPEAKAETQKLVGALREILGEADPLLAGRVEYRSLPQALPLESLASRRAADLAQPLNASVIFGREPASGQIQKPRLLLVLRLPDSTPAAPRPDLQRLQARLLYPASAQAPQESGSEWKPAAALARAHLLLAAGLGPGVVPALESLGQTPAEGLDWADFNQACGAVALAAAVAANAGPAALDLAVKRLSAAWQSRPDGPAKEAVAAAGVNLVSALQQRAALSRGNAADAGKARSLLDSLRPILESHPDLDTQALGLYLSAAAYSGASPTREAPRPSEAALNTLHRVQKHWTRETRPYAWASAQLVRAKALAAQSGSNQAPAHDQAIAAVEAALEILTRDPFPGEWAAAQSQLGGLYTTRPAGDRLDNLRHARDHCSLALEVWSASGAKEARAGGLANRAMILIQLPSQPPDENTRLAIADCRQALDAVTRQEQPELWARIQICLGVALKRLGQGRDPQPIAQALQHFKAALEIFQPQAYPLECAQTLNNLAQTYADMPGENRARSLQLALQAYDSALEALEFGLDRRIAPQIRQNRARAEQELLRLSAQTVQPKP